MQIFYSKENDIIRILFSKEPIIESSRALRAHGYARKLRSLYVKCPNLV